MGLSDGKILPNDANLLINLGLCRLLHAATHPLQQGLIDIQKSSDGQSFVLAQVYPGAIPVGLCPVVVGAYQDIAWGYQALNTAAVTVLGQHAGDTLFDLNADLGSLYTQYKVTTPPTTCDLSSLNDNPGQVTAPSDPGSCQ
jgi:hypothetical protein